jgi:hypothetical protein
LTEDCCAIADAAIGAKTAAMTNALFNTSFFITQKGATVAGGSAKLKSGSPQMRTQAARRACDRGCRTMGVQPAMSNGRFEFSDKDEVALAGLLKTKASHWSPVIV